MKDLTMACKWINITVYDIHQVASLSTMFLWQRPDWNQSKDLTCGLKRTGSVLNNSENVNDHDNDNGIENENNDGNSHNEEQ